MPAPFFDEYYPFDPGMGAGTANAARWRKMANLWAPDGVVSNYPYGNTPATSQLYATAITGGATTIQQGAVFIHGYYAEIQTPQPINVGAAGTIVAHCDFNTEKVSLLFTTATDYGSGGFEQDLNIWEIPLWGVSGSTLTDLRNLINPTTGIRWFASSPGVVPVGTGAVSQNSFGLARIPYAAQGFLHGTLLVQFNDISQAQNATCQLTYQWNQSDQQVSPIITPAAAGGVSGQTISVPVALMGVVPVSQGRKTFGWRVTAGPGPGISISQMTLSLWATGIAPVGT
jgi:hypothetical protein